MKKEDLWKIYCAKNPSFARPDALIAITGAGIKKFFETTYDRAHDQGFRNGKASAEMDHPPEPPTKPITGHPELDRMFKSFGL